MADNSGNADPFVKVADVTDIPDGTMLTVEVGEQLITVANAEGKYYAIGAVCSHSSWDLSEGTLDGHKITCAGHQAVWDLETGTAEFVVELDPEPLFEVKVEGNAILLNPTPKQTLAPQGS